MIDGAFQHGLRQVVLGALLAPFLLFSLIAAQVMPSRTLEGALVMVLCTSAGLQQVAIDPVSGEPVETDHPATAGPCIWSCATAEVTLPAPQGLPLVESRALPLCPSPPPFTLAAAQATGLPPSTGPPLAV